MTAKTSKAKKVDISKITGASPEYILGKVTVPHGTFAARLNAIDPKALNKAIAAALKASDPHIVGKGKYQIITGKGKAKVGVNAMALVNRVGNLAHGDYHPWRAADILTGKGFILTYAGSVIPSGWGKAQFASFLTRKAEVAAAALKASTRKAPKGKAKPKGK